jgi:hypothetical protein
VAVPIGSLKLAALLKDVADEPEKRAAAAVSLDVLQDARAVPKVPFWRGRQRQLALAVAVLVALGGAGAFWAFQPAATRTAPESQTQALGSGKQEPKVVARDIDPSAYSKGVQELMQYADDLRHERVAFATKFTGEEAAKQLGYSRLFASAYEEVILRVKTIEQSKKSAQLSDVIVGFDNIVHEEQTIDQLMVRKERHAAAIAYLRALQNGDVVFPGPQALAPTPPVVLAQLLAAYPDIQFDVDDPTFTAIYRQAREFAMRRYTSAGEIFAAEIIGELRRLIIQSAMSEADSTLPTICEKGVSVGELTALIAICPQLQLSRTVIELSQEVAQQPMGVDCRNKAASNLRQKLQGISDTENAEMCRRAALRVQAGENEFLEIAK